MAKSNILAGIKNIIKSPATARTVAAGATGMALGTYGTTATQAALASTANPAVVIVNDTPAPSSDASEASLEWASALKLLQERFNSGTDTPTRRNEPTIISSAPSYIPIILIGLVAVGVVVFAISGKGGKKRRARR